MDPPAEDRVVRVLDLYNNNSQPDPSTQVCLLQYPLRPPWRPYDRDYSRPVLYKPSAKRLQVEVPLNKGSAEYNTDADSSVQLGSIKLDSTVVDMRTTHAVLTIRGDKAVLTPIDEAYALRPSLAHMSSTRNEADAKAKAAAEDEEEEKPSEPQHIRVHVQRRETERQQESRLNSYAFLTEREQQEPWRELHAIPPQPDIVDAMLYNAVEDSVPMDLSQQDYSCAILPGFASTRAAALKQADELPASSLPALDGQKPKVAGLLGQKAGGKAAAYSEALSAEGREALRQAVKQLRRTLFSTDQLRKAIREVGSPASAELADKPQLALREAVQESGLLLYCKGAFIASSTGNAAQDAVRKLVVELLQVNEAIKKSDVMGAANAAGMVCTDKDYVKIMKELCTSKGSNWSLRKDGQDENLAQA
ncbi:g5141 [Coccomyxa viridis]|uniref:G5141 protein n=1 Tax=Coccomyxa viridis TaxID=1274662 RepID=A0ABP1FUD0_9CHLO